MSLRLETEPLNLRFPAEASRIRRAFLEAIPSGILGEMKPFLHERNLRAGAVLHEPGVEITEIFFPASAVVSLLEDLAEGTSTQVAMVGREGAIGINAAMNSGVAISRAVVQISGSATVIPVRRLAPIAAAHEPLRHLIARYNDTLLAQVQRTAACNARHSTEERVCRLLLHSRDLAHSDELSLTQESISEHLGVRRTTVTLIAKALQKAGLIDYRRGRIAIQDVNGLRDATCDCYEFINGLPERLLETQQDFAKLSAG